MKAAAAQPDAVRDAVARVWARRRSEIVTRVVLIERASEAAAAGELGEELRAAAEDAAHKLAGGAGTFGFAAASELARATEQILGSPPLGQKAGKELARLGELLRRELDRPLPHSNVTGA